MAEERMSVEVPAPMFIGPRLWPAYNIGNVGTVHITPDHYDDRGCLVWRYAVTDADGQELCQQADVMDGAGWDVNVVATMESLLGFMGAAGDAYRYEMENGAGSSENGKLFPPAMMEWCYVNSDEIGQASFELTAEQP